MKCRKSSRSAIASLEAFEGSQTSKSSRSLLANSKSFQPKVEILSQALACSRLFELRSKKLATKRHDFFGRRKKAQWFVIGAFLIITMISAAIMGKNAVKLDEDTNPVQRQVYQNIKADSEIALNSILYENRTSQNLEMRLKDYSNFIRDFGRVHAINATSYMIVGLPSEGGINVTVVNFQNAAMQPIEITINGTTQNATITDGSAATLAFGSVPDYFTVGYTIATPGEAISESESTNMTRRVFSAVKLRVESSDKNQVWQKAGWS